MKKTSFLWGKFEFFIDNGTWVYAINVLFANLSGRWPQFHLNIAYKIFKHWHFLRPLASNHFYGKKRRSVKFVMMIWFVKPLAFRLIHIPSEVKNTLAENLSSLSSCQLTKPRRCSWSSVFSSWVNSKTVVFGYSFTSTRKL